MSTKPKLTKHECDALRMARKIASKKDTLGLGYGRQIGEFTIGEMTCARWPGYNNSTYNGLVRILVNLRKKGYLTSRPHPNLDWQIWKIV